MKRRMATAVVAAGFIALSPAAALAYGAPSPSVGVSAGVVAAGELVEFSGDGFEPGSTVLIAVAEGDESPFVLGEVLTDDDGAFVVEIGFDEPGTYTLVASGYDVNGEERTLTSTVTVTGEAVSDDDSDDESGSDSGSGSTGGSGSANGSSGSDSHGATMHGGSAAGSQVSRSAVRTASAASTGSSADELAHTGVDGLGLQVGAAVALVVVGGAAVGSTALRRKRARA